MSFCLTSSRLPLKSKGSMKCFLLSLREETQLGESGQGESLLGLASEPPDAGVALKRIQTHSDNCFENKFFITPVQLKWVLRCIWLHGLPHSQSQNVLRRPGSP